MAVVVETVAVTAEAVAAMVVTADITVNSPVRFQIFKSGFAGLFY
jgi:hypothetical protein